MSMKPILFNTEMVKAILEGRKTVTRRIADINTEITCNDGTANHNFVLDNFTGGTPTGFVCRKCGFGVAPPHSRVPCGNSLFRPPCWTGDILYVRETWAMTSDILGGGGGPVYKAEFTDLELEELTSKHFRWRPSIHMPKEAARIFLRVKCVRVERLWDMTEKDALAEGVPTEWPMDSVYCPHCEINRFINLWNSTIKPADRDSYGWDANPWVWVIEFERCEKPKEDV